MNTARDLALDANGDLTVVGQDLAPLVVDVPAIVSDIRATIQFFQGEWFADLGQGIPWFQQALGQKNPNLAAIRASLFTAIGQCLGVTQVRSVTVAQLPGQRALSVSWVALADATLLGETVVVGA